MALALAGFGWVIARDSPPGERVSVAQMAGLFDVSPTEMLGRIGGLFVFDAWSARKLFGFVPAALHGYFWLLSVVHLAGFICAPLLVVYARENRALHMLGALISVVALLYFFSTDVPGNPVPEWPQRILSFYSPFTFLAGFAGPVFLLPRLLRGRWTEWHASAALRWALPSALLAWLVAAQMPVLSLGENVRAHYDELRGGFLKSGLRNAYVVFSDIEEIRPFYLRALPYLLFSDPQIVERNLMCVTEWHHQARHPTRVTEAVFDLGRPRYLARFSQSDGRLKLALEPRPSDSFPVPDNPSQPGYMNLERLARAQFEQGLSLFAQGATRDAAGHLRSALRLGPDSPDIHNNLAVVLSNLGRHEEALAHLETAVRLAPDAENANLNLAAMLLAKGDKARAAQLVGHILKLRPASARAQEMARQIGSGD